MVRKLLIFMVYVIVYIGYRFTLINRCSNGIVRYGTHRVIGGNYWFLKQNNEFKISRMRTTKIDLTDAEKWNSRVYFLHRFLYCSYINLQLLLSLQYLDGLALSVKVFLFTSVLPGPVSLLSRFSSTHRRWPTPYGCTA